MTDVSLSLLGRHVAHSRYPLSFHAPEHTLHRRIIPAVATTIHALAYAISPKPLAKLSAAALGALILVKQQALRLAALFVGHIQRLDHQISIRLAR